MDFDGILLASLLLFLSFVLCCFLWQRFLWRLRKRLGLNPGFYPSTASLGDAFQSLQTLAQPQMTYVLEEKQEEPAEDDDAGGPQDPVAHLHRQAAKIRRGEKVDRLTVLFP